MQKIASMRLQLEGRKLPTGKSPKRAVKGGLGTATRVTMDKNLQLAQQVDDLGMENLRLRDVLRKASSSMQNANSLHRDGAMSQLQQMQRSMSMARAKVQSLFNETVGELRRIARTQSNRAVASSILKAHSRLADDVMDVLNAYEDDARHYTPPSDFYGLKKAVNDA
eukprot:scaffold43724_cov44-Prasinocladus_malaysianus.AAC.1